MTVRCAKCSTSFSDTAKFCPRCGEAAPTVATGQATTPAPIPQASIDFGKMSAPIPPAGVAFLVALVLAPASIILGIMFGLKALIVVGIVLIVLLVLVLVLGQFF
jgi:hypothetical protein